MLKRVSLRCPVIVVGNITVGGTGKTPFVVWLVNRLRREGWSPGIVSRGYGGRGREYPYDVNAEADPRQMGDEPVLLATEAQCPVVVDAQRARGAARLIEEHECDIVICDDGLQHYYLNRDLEIAIIDGARGLGNGFLLPAGPLREPQSRLRRCHWVLGLGETTLAEYRMQMRIEWAMHALHTQQRRALSGWSGTVHAIAGIGRPERFFTQLRELGLRIVEHPFPDHHAFVESDITFQDNWPVLMTAKDWVKIRAFAHERCWYVPVSLEVDEALLLPLMDWSRQARTKVFYDK